MNITISVQANFTPDEALAILQKVRDVEQGRPEVEVRVLVNAPEMTLEENRNLLDQVKPPFKYRAEMEKGETFLGNVSGNGDP